MRAFGLGLTLALACLLAAFAPSAPAQESSDDRPNFVFVLTDDMSADMLSRMPNVRRVLTEQGTTFTQATHTTPLCCPSRASMLTGLYAHNHGVETNLPPDGGIGLFVERGNEAETFAVALDGAGYRTGYAGKYLNGYDSLRVPLGWDRWWAIKGESGFKTKVFNENGAERSYPDRHLDSVIAERAVKFAESSAKSGAPFFLEASFFAPHAPYPHEAKYGDYFRRAQPPRPPSYNEADVSDKPAWVSGAPRITTEQERGIAADYRNGLRALQTVDLAVMNIAKALARQGELQDTYFVFYSDNGKKWGQHRIYPASKQTAYREDWRFPMTIRGPGVPAGQRRGEIVTNSDLAPTFADLAGTTLEIADARSMEPLLNAAPGEAVPWRDAALVEGWEYPNPLTPSPTYKAVRTEGDIYVEYENGEHELYDLEADPYQLESKHDDLAYADEMAALSARLEALKGCAGETCRAAEGP